MKTKIKPDSKEAKFLQEVINIMCAYNRCDKAFISTFFKGREAALEAAYRVLDGTLICSLQDNRLYTRDVAFEKIGRSGVQLMATDYLENIYATQLTARLIGPQHIHDTDTALVDAHAATTAGKYPAGSVINKILIGLLVANIIVLGIYFAMGGEL